MEASMTDGGTAEATGTQDGGQPQEGQQQGGDNALLERFSQFESQFNDRMGQLEQSFQPGDGEGYDDGAEGEGEGEGEADRVFVDPQTGEVFDQYGQPVEDDAGQFDPEQERAQIAEQLKAEMQQQIAPLQERFRQEDIAKIEEKYPDLRDPEKARPVVEAAQAAARQFGSPEMWQNPDFIEQTYLAQQARERAESETPAGAEQGFDLEGGGPAGSGGSEVDVGDAIVKARGGNGFWS